MLQSNEMHDSVPLVSLHSVHVHPTNEQSHKVKCKESVNYKALLAILYLRDKSLSVTEPLLIFSTFPITSFSSPSFKMVNLSLYPSNFPFL